MRFWSADFVFCLCYSLFGLVLRRHGGNSQLVTHPLVIALVIGAALYKLAEHGQVLEGLIVALTDDGIDRLYTVYYEYRTNAYELDFTSKCKSPAGGLQRGDIVTLILPPMRIGRQQKLVLFPIVLLDLPTTQKRAA
jgi:hypothetical protein